LRREIADARLHARPPRDRQGRSAARRAYFDRALPAAARPRPRCRRVRGGDRAAERALRALRRALDADAIAPWTEQVAASARARPRAARRSRARAGFARSRASSVSPTRARLRGRAADGRELESRLARDSSARRPAPVRTCTTSALSGARPARIRLAGRAAAHVLALLWPRRSCSRAHGRRCSCSTTCCRARSVAARGARDLVAAWARRS
jgi:hypothetical protein